MHFVFITFVCAKQLFYFVEAALDCQKWIFIHFDESVGEEQM